MFKRFRQAPASAGPRGRFPAPLTAYDAIIDAAAASAADFMGRPYEEKQPRRARRPARVPADDSRRTGFCQDGIAAISDFASALGLRAKITTLDTIIDAAGDAQRRRWPHAFFALYFAISSIFARGCAPSFSSSGRIDICLPASPMRRASSPLSPIDTVSPRPLRASPRGHFARFSLAYADTA